jgi:hypothetical protein
MSGCLIVTAVSGYLVATQVRDVPVRTEPEAGPAAGMKAMRGGASETLQGQQAARGRRHLLLTYSTFSGVQPVTIDVSRDRDRPPAKDYSQAMNRLYGVTYDVARAGVVLPRPGRQ